MSVLAYTILFGATLCAGFIAGYRYAYGIRERKILGDMIDLYDRLHDQDAAHAARIASVAESTAVDVELVEETRR